MAIPYRSKEEREVLTQSTEPLKDQYERITRDTVKQMAKLKTVKAARWQYLTALNRMRDAIDDWMHQEIAAAKESVQERRRAQ